MFRILIIIVLSLCALSSSSQRLRFSQINIKTGLSQSTVRGVVQDNDGYIWIGTEDGLNRYDGVDMTVFRPGDKQGEIRLKDGYISTITKTDNGNIWIGTREAGIIVYSKNSKSSKSLVSDSTGGAGLLSNRIYRIEAIEGSVYVCSDKGVDHYNEDGEFVSHIWDKSLAKDYSTEIHDVSFVGENILLASHGNGLIIKNGDKFKSVIPLDEEGDELRRNLDKMRSIMTDSQGRTWLGYYGGGLAKLTDDLTVKLFEYSGEENAFSARAVNDIYEDHAGAIWFATNRGLASYNEERSSFKFVVSDEEDPLAIADNNVYTVYEDQANSIWAGTQLGASVYHRTLGKFNHIKYDKGSSFALKQSKKVYAFGEDNLGNIWIGTDGGGLNRFNFKKEEMDQFLKADNNVHNTVLAIHAFQNRIWFGSYGGGIGAYSLDSNAFINPITSKNGLPSSTILSLNDDGEALLIGTYKGLVRYWKENDSLEVYEENHVIKSNSGVESWLGGGQIHTITKIGGKYWLGTQNGISIFDIQQNLFKNINEDSGLVSSEVYSIKADSKGKVWVGTSNGLVELSQDGTIQNVYTTDDGLGSNFIYGILIDDKNGLWLSTNNGLTLFNPYMEGQSSEKSFVRQYNEIDGLQADEFNQGAYFKSSKGEMFFGGVNGFNHFYPQSIEDNQHKPGVVLRAFRLFDQESTLAEFENEEGLVEFTYKQNYLEFEFAALDYVLPNKNTYQFMLVGVDESWSAPTSYNKVSYKDLKPGDYVLKVRAYNNDGIPSDEIYELAFTIIPPFWQTTWFYIVCVLMGALSVFVFIRLRMRKIKIEKKILEDKVDERTKELAAKSDELEEKNTEIVDSINYAKKIQSAILPDIKTVEEYLEDSFILYLPKDIVSGDFYWFGVKNGKIIITAVDCTGHGVPGAFMSMIGSNLLNQIVLEKGVCTAGEILSQLNRGVQIALKQGTESQETNDGMDISLCVIDNTSMKLEWAGAYNPLYHIRKGDLTKLKANKYPIGGAHMEMDRTYDTHVLELVKGDCLYMFSDGFVDQFGGEKGKKFMGKRFQKTLLDINERPMSEQYTILSQVLDAWMGGHEQVDDICVIGIRV